MVEWQSKIDHRLRALWARTPEPDREDLVARIMMRVTCTGPTLMELGVQVHAVAGDIVSGSITLGDLPRIANAGEILFIELAQPLAPDR